MKATLVDLVAHKGYANAVMLREVGQSFAAVADADLQALLHHILLANRFWAVRSVSLTRPASSPDPRG